MAWRWGRVCGIGLLLNTTPAKTTELAVNPAPSAEEVELAGSAAGQGDLSDPPADRLPAKETRELFLSGSISISMPAPIAPGRRRTTPEMVDGDRQGEARLHPDRLQGASAATRSYPTKVGNPVPRASSAIRCGSGAR